MLRIEDGHGTTSRHRGALVDNRRQDLKIDKIVMPGPRFSPQSFNIVGSMRIGIDRGSGLGEGIPSLSDINFHTRRGGVHHATA